MSAAVDQFQSLFARSQSVLKTLTQMGYPPERWHELPDDLREQVGLAPADDEHAWTSLPCPTCLDHGDILHIYTRNGVEEYRESVPCPDCEKGRAAQQVLYERRFRDSGLPKRFANCTFESWDQQFTQAQKKGKQLAYHAARLLVEHRRDGYFFTLSDAYRRLQVRSPLTDDPARNSLVLYGDLGLGKTGLAASIANALMNDVAVLYLRVQDLIKQVQDTYKSDYQGVPRSVLLHNVKTAPFLILDEFTLEIDSDDRREIMEEIMRFRCGRELPFVVTTNHDVDTFTRVWRGRIADVLRESAHWVPIGGENLRRRAETLTPI